jgi:hypothetical protein
VEPRAGRGRLKRRHTNLKASVTLSLLDEPFTEAETHEDGDAAYLVMELDAPWLSTMRSRSPML